MAHSRTRQCWFDIGGVSLLVGDITYGVLQLRGTWLTGTPLDLLWAGFYIAWGAAALHPSMARLTEPRLSRWDDLSSRRLLAMVFSTLIAPTVLLIAVLRGPAENARVIVIAVMRLASGLPVGGDLEYANENHARAGIRGSPGALAGQPATGRCGPAALGRLVMIALTLR